MAKKVAAFAGSLVLLGSLFAPSLASASSLTQDQISSILALLQSFGADASTIANVNTALGGSSAPSGSCSAFADLKYGDFDTAPGGRVSQLQTFLGIPATSFGFGTYGPKTLAAWNARCGANPQLETGPGCTLTTDKATAQVGGQITVSWTTQNATRAQFIADAEVALSGSRVESAGQTAGTWHEAMLVWGADNKQGRCDAYVTVSASAQPSVTIDQSSLTTSSGNPTITGSASNVSSVYVVVSAPNHWGSETSPVVNGQWSTTITSFKAENELPAGTYTVTVQNGFNGPVLATGTLTVTSNPTVSCSISANPSQPYVNGEYTLSWNWNGSDPYAANNPYNTAVIHINRSFGPGIILANPANPFPLWESQATTDTATLGTGSIYDSSNFTPVCSVNVPVLSDGASGGTITSSSLLQRPNQSFTLVGSDSYDANGSRNVFVDIIPASYSGNRSWNAIQNVFPATTYYADAVNGNWAASFTGGMSGGDYTVLVYDVSSTPKLIASGLLTVTDKG